MRSEKDRRLANKERGVITEFCRVQTKPLGYKGKRHNWRE